MILSLIEDINKALDAECYFSALALVLTLPDICGKAEFPNEKSTSKRYKAWYDNYIGKYEICPSSDREKEVQMPYLSGEVVYSLRNSFLHQGTPNIATEKIKESRNKLKRFELIIQKPNKLKIYADCATVENEEAVYEVNVCRLCLIMCQAAEAYYNENPSKFDFFNFTVRNRDEEYERVSRLNRS